MNISVVRGAFLNPFECQLYAPLTRTHNLTLVGADWQFYRHPTIYPSTQVMHANLWGAGLSKLYRTAPVHANRLMSWSTGRSFGFYDLERCTEGADILHSAETFFTMTHQCVALKRMRRCPLVVTVSENLPHMGELHPVRRHRKKDAIQAADQFIAITETSRRTLIIDGVPEEKITVIPWSLDLGRFRPAPKDPELLARLQIQADDCVVLFIGRLVVEKGIRDILHCAPQVAARAKNNRLRFLFVGEGPLKADILAAQRLYPDLIRLHSFVPYDQLPAFHNLADLFLLPSRTGRKIAEQFGFVLIESMACGKPIITTPIGSIRDVVGDAALLTALDDPKALTDAILQLVESPSERASLSSKALTRAAKHFDAEVNARYLESIYQSLQRQAR